MKPPVPHKIYETSHVVRLHPDNDAEATTWPWPFRADDDENSPAWKARYAPAHLTQTDLYELASIADAYRTMITHPCRSVAETIFELRKIFKVTYR